MKKCFVRLCIWVFVGSLCVAGGLYGAEKDANEKKADRARIELLQERLARIEAQSVILQQQFKEAKAEFDQLIAAAKAEEEKTKDEKEKKDAKPIKK